MNALLLGHVSDVIRQDSICGWFGVINDHLFCQFARPDIKEPHFEIADVILVLEIAVIGHFKGGSLDFELNVDAVRRQWVWFTHDRIQSRIQLVIISQGSVCEHSTDHAAGVDDVGAWNAPGGKLPVQVLVSRQMERHGEPRLFPVVLHLSYRLTARHIQHSHIATIFFINALQHRKFLLAIRALRVKECEQDCLPRQR